MSTENTAQLAVFQCYSWSSWQVFLRESQEFCCVCFSETFLFFLMQTVKVAAACVSCSKLCMENEKKCHKIVEWSISFHNEVYSKNNRVGKGDVLMIPLWEAKCRLIIIIQFRKKWDSFKYRNHGNRTKYIS